MLKYAGIGARKTPQEVLDRMTAIAQALPDWQLRSGGAAGADSAFEAGANHKEIWLPWAGYNDKVGFITSASDYIYQSAEMFHPNWAYCKDGARLLFCRNMNIMAGIELDDPVDIVICWTPNAAVIGGTGHALRVAAHLEVPVINLAHPNAEEDLAIMVDRLEKAN